MHSSFIRPLQEILRISQLAFTQSLSRPQAIILEVFHCTISNMSACLSHSPSLSRLSGCYPRGVCFLSWTTDPSGVYQIWGGVVMQLWIQDNGKVLI